MADRYAVRRSERGCGVWDTTTNEWAPYRTVDPPKPVILAAGGEQHLGTLHAWSREAGQWWGRVTIGAHGGWYPASTLRQA